MYPDAKIPIIALSANAFKEDVEKSKKTVVFRLRSFFMVEAKRLELPTNWDLLFLFIFIAIIIFSLFQKHKT